MDVQFWDNDRICIRSIPAELPQFNLQQWVKKFKPQIKPDDIQFSDLLACCQFSAYDVGLVECEQIKEDILNHASPLEIAAFAKCLDFSNCRKLFK